MSTCIHENCDETTVEDRPKQPSGLLVLSQLYCLEHLQEATEEVETSAQNQLLATDE